VYVDPDALVSGQQTNNNYWTSYINGPGSGLSEAEQIAQYPSSQQFSDNEAVANTVAAALAQRFSGVQNLGFTPTNGFASC
tara:strand:- start:923 stop:1165 length:243 start_codon:yes stop_codon:yes gene_type:complete